MRVFYAGYGKLSRASLNIPSAANIVTSKKENKERTNKEVGNSLTTNLVISSLSPSSQGPGAKSKGAMDLRVPQGPNSSFRPGGFKVTSFPSQKWYVVLPCLCYTKPMLENWTMDSYDGVSVLFLQIFIRSSSGWKSNGRSTFNFTFELKHKCVMFMYFVKN